MIDNKIFQQNIKITDGKLNNFECFQYRYSQWKLYELQCSMKNIIVIFLQFFFKAKKNFKNDSLRICPGALCILFTIHQTDFV